MSKLDFLSETEQALLVLISDALHGTENKIDFDTVDWTLLKYEAYIQTVSVLAFSKLNKDTCNEEELNGIRNYLKPQMSRNIAVNNAHIFLHSVMQSAGIPYTIIKGAASAAYYPDAFVRSMGDVDFLINRSDYERTDALLIEKGFVRSDRGHFYHIVYEYNGCRYEMHFEPAGIPDGKVGAVVHGYLADLLECAREQETVFGKIVVPSAFHHGLIMLMHMSHHLTTEGIGLRHLCDWAVFIKAFSEEEFCGIFEEKLKAIGLWDFTKLMTRICTLIFGCPQKAWAGEHDSELEEGVIRDIFKGGNFGQKSSARTHESLLISNASKGGIEEKSMVAQFIDSVNDVVYAKWPASKRFKLLLPFGWLFFLGRYVIRSILGKRPKIEPKKIAAEATQRKELYEKLNLFVLKDN